MPPVSFSTYPFAITIAAHLKTMATKAPPQARYAWRWKINTALYEKGLPKQDILEPFRMIYWFIILPEILTRRFTEDLIHYEEGKKCRIAEMPCKGQVVV